MKKNNLKKIRKEKNLTAKELSEKVGVTDVYIYLLEQGSKKPSFGLSFKIAKVLHVKVDDIWNAKDLKQ